VSTIQPWKLATGVVATQSRSSLRDRERYQHIPVPGTRKTEERSKLIIHEGHTATPITGQEESRPFSAVFLTGVLHDETEKVRWKGISRGYESVHLLCGTTLDDGALMKMEHPSLNRK
jgi:hypothetical protein